MAGPVMGQVSFRETTNSYSNFFVPPAFIHSLNTVCAKFSRFLGKQAAQREGRENFFETSCRDTVSYRGSEEVSE
jgi:hypothetical protein